MQRNTTTYGDMFKVSSDWCTISVFYPKEKNMYYAVALETIHIAILLDLILKMY